MTMTKPIENWLETVKWWRMGMLILRTPHMFPMDFPIPQAPDARVKGEPRSDTQDEHLPDRLVDEKIQLCLNLLIKDLWST